MFDGEGGWLQLDEEDICRLKNYLTFRYNSAGTSGYDFAFRYMVAQEAKSLMLIQGFLDIGVLGVPQDHVQGGERIKQLLRLI